MSAPLKLAASRRCWCWCSAWPPSPAARSALTGPTTRPSAPIPRRGMARCSRRHGARRRRRARPRGRRRSAASPSPTTACACRSPSTSLPARARDHAALHDRRRRRPGARLRGRAREADAPDRRPPRRHAASSTCTRRWPPTARGARRSRCPTRAPTASSPTSSATAENETLAADLTVDGDADYAPLPERTDVDTTDGYRVELDAHDGKLGFAITRDGKPVETEPYLGAGGHLVALREGDLAFLHVHPVDGRRRRVRDRARPGLALPPVPAVQARGPRPHRGVHAMSAQIELPITGMTCASCANRIERKLNKLEGVDRERQLRDREGDRRLRPGGRRSPSALVGAVEAAGYQAVLPSRRARARRAGRRDRAAALPADRLRAALAAGAAGLDDPGAAVRQLAVAGAEPGHAGRASGARGRSTAPRGRTCATARRRWTR